MPTGVEIAGQIAELSRSGLERNFRRIDPADAQVVLVDGGKEILAAFGDRLSEKATTELEQPRRRRSGRGTVVTRSTRSASTSRTATALERLVAAHQDLGGRRAGLARWRGLLAEAAGRRATGPAGSPYCPTAPLPGHPEVFAIGDMMALDDLPGVAEVAMQTGIHAANTIKRRLSGKEAASVHLPRPRQHGDRVAASTRS